MASVETDVATKRLPVTLRVTYFSEFHKESPLEPSFAEVERAMAQMKDLMEFGFELTDLSKGASTTRQPTRARRFYRLVSLRMQSPLEIMVEISRYGVGGLTFAGGVLLIAERIATFTVRVAAKREQELLKTDLYREQRIDVQRRVDEMASKLSGYELGRVTADFSEQGDSDEDLVEHTAPSE